MKLLLFTFLMGMCLSNGLYLEADQNQELTYVAHQPTQELLFGNKLHHEQMMTPQQVYTMPLNLSTENITETYNQQPDYNPN